jgi:iron complex outermembrane receptor protein
MERANSITAAVGAGRHCRWGEARSNLGVFVPKIDSSRHWTQVMKSAGEATIANRAVVVLAIAIGSGVHADDRLPVLPISLQTSDGPQTQSKSSGDGPEVPEASDAASLPRVPRASDAATGAARSPEASASAEGPALNPGESLVSQLAAGARATATTQSTQSNPAAPATVVPPILNASGAGELLQQASTVSVRRASAINLDARIRAFNPSQINAVAGGVNQLKTRIDIDSLFSQIDPAHVQAMTVIDGPYSSLYGPGFAFLIADMRSPRRFDSPQGSLKSAFGYETNGSQLFWRQGASAGGTAWGFLSSFGQRVGNDYTSGGDRFRIPASFGQWDGFASFSLDVANNQTFDLFYLHNEQNDVELPGVAYDLRQSANHQFSLRYAVWEGDRETERLVLHAWATDTRFRGDNFAPSKQSTFFGRFIGVPFGPYNEPGLGSLSTLLTHGGSSTVGARGYLKLGDPDGWQLIAGLDWRLEKLFYREADFDPFGNVAFGGNLFGIPHARSSSAGMFFNLNGKFDSVHSITAGGRFDAWRAGFDADDPVTAAGDPNAYPTSLFAGRNEPQRLLGMGFITARRELSESTSLTAGAAVAMRPPGLAELYSDQPWAPLVRFGNSFSMGDSELDPERLIQLDAGAKGAWDALSLGARTFIATVNDYILYRPVPVGGDARATVPGNGPAQLGRRLGESPLADDAAASFQYANLARATLYGGDVSAEWRPQSWCTAFCSLAYVKGINEDPVVILADGTYGGKGAEGLPGIAPLQGVVGLRFFEPVEDRYGIEFMGRLTARQDYLADSLGELGTPGYTVWNLRGWLKLNECVTISSAVKNVFNRDYTQHGSLAIADPNSGAFLFVPEPGVSWVTALEISY